MHVVRRAIIYKKNHILISDLLNTILPDFICITETWTTFSSKPLIHGDYIFHHFPRTYNIVGGSVGIIIF